MNSKKIFALLLALCLVVSLFAGCAKTTEEAESETTPVESEATSVDSEAEAWEGLDWDAIAEMDYDDASDAIYDYALGEYYEYYTKAKEETANMSKRYALMAIAEAKMLEAGAEYFFVEQDNAALLPDTLQQVEDSIKYILAEL